MGILLKNGFVIDGSGVDGYDSDILIEGDKISKISKNIETENDKVIDVSGKIVCPGFIDMHNHADLTVYEANKTTAFIEQGLTTLLVGVCGLGVSPSNKLVQESYYKFIHKAFCVSPALYENIDDYFKALESKGVNVNLAFMIPQGNVRACVMGTKEGDASQEELEQMKSIIRENMELGAFGLSTGLVYPPGSSTSTEELIQLSKEVSKYNGFYDSHMRNEGAEVIEVGMNELIRIAREANIHAHISHWSVITGFGYQELTQKAIKLRNDALDEGLNITADITTYPDGFTSLSFVMLPTWVYSDFHENLTNPETRKKIKKEIFDKIYSMYLADAPFYLRILPRSLLRKIIFPKLSKGVTVIFALNNHEMEGKTLYEIFNILYPEKDIEDALLDYFRDEDGGIMIRIKQKHEEESMIPLLSQKGVAPSSDAVLILDGNNHPRTFNSFPRVIARWVREKQYFTLPEAIRKMTSLPAGIIGIKDRGLIKEGMKADIVVFDYDEIQDMGTLENGNQAPKGLDYVIINGDIAVSDGKYQGNLSGLVLRKDQ
ncbi:MAG: amidohydrolase family protein [Candidatus Lokiarchaeota archaeon]|nr:amidohydrolase family protein [Candidatus Lokiarchaeota archaeon]MBD3200204.1 amidohydrolase family protein [Candidatus Lokiarchaeota archaeon]